jgi:hypothetical protein
MEVFGRGGWPGRIGFRQAARGKGGEVEIKPVSADYEDRSLNIDGSGRLAITVMGSGAVAVVRTGAV